MMLDKKGGITAIVFGALMYYFAGLNFLLLMLFFFFLSIVITKYGYYEKKEMGIYEYERGFENVISNGIVPTFLALASPYVGWLPFACSVAGVTADKFSSELGVFEEKPFSLFLFKRVKEGTSGAVSIFGLLCSFIGGLMIGLGSFYLFSASINNILFIGLAGFVGSFSDSVAGVFEERGIGTKGTSNVICSIASGGMGFL